MKYVSIVPLCCVALLITGCSQPPEEQPPETVTLIDLGTGADAGDELGDLADEVADAGDDLGDEADLADMSPALDMPVEEDMLSSDMGPVAETPCGREWSWSSGTEFAGAARDHHVTFIHQMPQGASLHVISGTNYRGLFDDHWRAPILENNELGEWEQAPKLPYVRGGMAYAPHRDKHLFLGGRDARGMVQTVLVSTHGEDGEITGFEETTPLPAPRFHGAAAVSGDRVYVSGGLTGSGQAQSSLFIGELDEESHVTSWREASLPEARSHHASFVYEGHLYLLHGFSGNPFQNATMNHQDIVRARIDPQTGDPGEWEVFLEDNVGLSTMAATLSKDCVCRLGGLMSVPLSGYDYSNAMVCYDLDSPSGVVSKTQHAFTLGRSHMHQAPFYNGAYYIVGGSEDYQTVTTEVEIGRVVPR